jgi:hypothetical protein
MGSKQDLGSSQLANGLEEIRDRSLGPVLGGAAAPERIDAAVAQAECALFGAVNRESTGIVGVHE